VFNMNQIAAADGLHRVVGRDEILWAVQGFDRRQ
jgi:hypothetical protein